MGSRPYRCWNHLSQARSTAKGSKEFGVRVSVVQMRAFNYQEPIRAGLASSLRLVSALVLLASAPLGHSQEPPSLMTMIGQWQYPGSKISGATLSDAATMNASGERTRPSVQYRAILITKDPMAKVIAYYESKLKPAAGSKTSKSDEPPVADSGQSVTFHDDSEGRPVAIHVILVNTDRASTTLVISRAATEPATHIAWAHYERH